MTNHPGDYHSFLHLAQLREEQLERKSRHHHLLTESGYHFGVRARFAGLLRSMADRVESRTPVADQPPAPRYQRAP
jgi:hypothetical protein